MKAANDIGPAAPADIYDIGHRAKILGITADLVARYGDVALPLFERAERELAIAETKSAAKNRALMLARKAG